MTLPTIICCFVVALLITGIECGYTSSSAGSSSASDGSGQTFTQTSNNGQGQFVHTQTRPGGMTVTQTGGVPPPNNQFYGPANFGQPGFGSQYGPGFPYAPFGTNMPAFSPFPQQPGFGFNSPFQPLQPFQPIQPFQPFQPIQPFAPFPQSIATPQEFSAYLNGIQQQYNTYYKQQQELLNAWKNQPYMAGYGGVPNYAYATGAFGPNGIQQTAGVFPPNKFKPNVDNRVDPSDTSAGTVPGGFFGVQTSSFSSSSDINGIKKHKEGAVTTVNDNGKVTTYQVANP